MKTKHILITGGNGLIGRNLTQALLAQGHKVSHLSRSRGNTPGIETFLWDIKKKQIDNRCVEGVDTIVHLAGAGITEERWTDQRKQEIVDSRINSILLIYQLLKTVPHQVSTVISASGIVYYGNRGEEVLDERCLPAGNFLGECCAAWEAAVDEGKQLGLRIVKFRTGVVLSGDGGALPEMIKQVRSGFGAPAGSGQQWVSWIHFKDVVGLYQMVVNSDVLEGVYNQTAPNPVRNRVMIQAVAKRSGKKMWIPFIPAFILRLFMGETSQLLLDSTRATSTAIVTEGYRFQFENISDALNDIYKLLD